MSDINSGLPFRTQIPGQTNYDDVVTKLADGVTASQLASVDTFGSVKSRIADATGAVVTSQNNGTQRALDVGINVAGVQIDPRITRALTAADVVTVQQGTSPWITKDQSDGPVTPGTAAAFSQLMGGQYNSTFPTLTTGQQSAIQLDSSGRQLVAAVLTQDQNYGTVGANTLRVAAQIGNATGAADFNFGSVSAQTLRVASQIGNATGSVDYNFGAASAQTLRSAALIGNATGLVDFNYGVVSAQTIRVASQMGNATGVASFGNGVTGTQTLRVAANLAVAGTDVSATNPVPVTFSAAPLGSPVNNFNTVSAVAAAATSNHDYTITTAKTFQGKKIWASASGLLKIEVQASPDGVTFSTIWVGFNSTSEPNIPIDMDQMVFLDSGTGSKIRIIRTNMDKKAMDVYSTISGVEV